MKAASATLVTALGLLLTACSGSVVQAPTDDAELVQGQNVYASNCASCHRSDGSGARGSRLNNGVLLERFPDAADQRRVIEEGRGTMPGYGKRLSEAELDAVVRYTREVLNP